MEPSYTADIRSLLGAGGIMASYLPQFEVREGQLALAEAVGEVLESGGSLAVEAPTGIGKSLGYLVPAALHSLSQRLPVVIATHTRNLQDQLVDKDVPLLTRAVEELWGEELTVTVVKGRANYLCGRRFEELSSQATTPGADPRLGGLMSWAASTTTGELSEAEEWVGSLGPLKDELASEPGSCVWGRCRRGPTCFIRRLRERVRQSHLVVVNHALLLTHLLHDGNFLPDADAVIFDEGHHVEEALLRASGCELSQVRLRLLRTRLFGTGRADGGDFGRLTRALAALPSQVDRLNLMTRLGAARERLDDGSRAVLGVLQALTGKLDGVTQPLRYALEERETVASVELVADGAYEHGRAVVDDGRRALSRLHFAMEDANERSAGALDDAIAELGGMAGRWSGLANDLEALASPGDEDVCWIESGRDGASLHASPLSVGARMAEIVLPRFRASILTSATLTVSRSFDHLSERLGLDRLDRRSLFTMSLDTPFDYPANCRLLVDRSLPAPGAPEFAAMVVDTIAGLARMVPRRTLVLFTSWALLRRVHSRLAPIMKSIGRPLLAQGIDGPRRQVARSHRRQAGSLLLATQSFWEGVDFPGEELEILVLTRLPFPVPSEPLVEARSERLRSDGREPFTELFLPASVLRFRQGFGRLIRGRHDRGVVLCLDARLASARYRRAFVDSLPVDPLVVAPGTLVEATLDWLEDDPRLEPLGKEVG